MLWGFDETSLCLCYEASLGVGLLLFPLLGCLCRHKETDVLPLLVSTVTRMWFEFHPSDVRQFRRHPEETEEGQGPMAVDGGEETEETLARPPAVTIAGKNHNYPNELAGFIRDKEYVEKLLELMGGCPKLPEAGALTADQIYAQVRGDPLAGEVSPPVSASLSLRRQA